MTETKFNLRERLYEYLKANKLNLTMFFITCNSIFQYFLNTFIHKISLISGIFYL